MVLLLKKINIIRFNLIFTFLISSCFWGSFQIHEDLIDKMLNLQYQKFKGELFREQKRLQEKLEREKSESEIESIKRETEKINKVNLISHDLKIVTKEEYLEYFKKMYSLSFNYYSRLKKILEENREDIVSLIIKEDNKAIPLFTDYVSSSNLIFRLIKSYKEKKLGLIEDFQSLKLDPASFVYSEFVINHFKLFSKLLERFPYIDLTFFEKIFSIYE